MPTKRIEISANTRPESNVIRISSPQQQVDFCKESVQIKFYFDGEREPSIDIDVTSLILQNNQPHGLSTDVPVMGDNAIVEISTPNELILDLITVEPVYENPINYLQEIELTNVIQRFSGNVGINGFWGVRFNDRAELMVEIGKRSLVHHDILNTWLNSYETLAILLSDQKLKKQYPEVWNIRHRDALRNHEIAREQLIQFCQLNNIAVQ
ncbi:MAG: hypothetical protein L6Q81_05070 [Bacteroidia bacterium]|nr:hypothetical protein [Bacteroidia bacterium]